MAVGGHAREACAGDAGLSRGSSGRRRFSSGRSGKQGDPPPQARSSRIRRTSVSRSASELTACWATMRRRHCSGEEQRRLGALCAAAGRHEEAAVAFTAALVKWPADAGLLDPLATAFETLGKDADATRILMRLRDADLADMSFNACDQDVGFFLDSAAKRTFIAFLFAHSRLLEWSKIRES